MSPEEEIIRAGEARQILDSRMMREARENLEAQLAHLRRSVPIKDTDMQSRVILMEHMYVLLMSWFEQIALTGRMAELTLAERERQRSLLEQGIAMFKRVGRNA